jgi:hypothetical protein
MRNLSSAQSELDYLCELLPSEERVLALASITGTGMEVEFGVVALTPQRLITILGRRDRGQPTGAPAVTTTELRSIRSLSFGSKHVRGVHGYFARFVVAGEGEFMMDVGGDDDWADAFLNAVQRQANQAKFE